MVEHEAFEIEPLPPRWLKPAVWLSIPAAALAFLMATVSILDIRALRGTPAAAEVPALAQPAAAPPSRDFLARDAAVVTEDDATLARLRAEGAAEEARIAVLAEAARSLAASGREAEAFEEPAAAMVLAEGAVPAAVEVAVAPLPAPPRDVPPAPALPAPAHTLAGLVLPPVPPLPPGAAGGPDLPPLPALMPPPPAAAAPGSVAEATPPALRPPGLAEPPRPASLSSPAPRERSGAETASRAGTASRSVALGRADPPPRRASDPRCGPLLARLQLGERPTDADRSILQSACAPRS